MIITKLAIIVTTQKTIVAFLIQIGIWLLIICFRFFIYIKTNSILTHTAWPVVRRNEWITHTYAFINLFVSSYRKNKLTIFKYMCVGFFPISNTMHLLFFRLHYTQCLVSASLNLIVICSVLIPLERKTTHTKLFKEVSNCKIKKLWKSTLLTFLDEAFHFCFCCSSSHFNVCCYYYVCFVVVGVWALGECTRFRACLCQSCRLCYVVHSH